MRERMGGRRLKALVVIALKFRVGSNTDSTKSAIRYVLRGLARRYRALDKEIRQLNRQLDHIVAATAPQLLARFGIGTDVAGALLVAAGDTPQRLRTESSFAALCGVSPVDASSGRQRRHRLNRGGNRDANRALWVIAFVRMRGDERTRAYVERRTMQGLSKPEVLRCLKRYIAREVYKLLRSNLVIAHQKLQVIAT